MKARHCHPLVIWLVALATIFAGCATPGTTETSGASGAAGGRPTAGGRVAPGRGPPPPPQEFLPPRGSPPHPFLFGPSGIKGGGANGPRGAPRAPENAPGRV